MAHARLMGAISPKRNRQSAHTDPPEPAASEGILFSEARLVRNSSGGRSRNGRPGSRARAGMRASEARGLSEGTRRKPDTDGRANQEGFAMAARRSERCDRIRLSIWFAASRGSTNAGGEDFGYFAPWEKRVRIPPLTSRTVEAALARAVASRVSVLPPGRTCV